MAWQSDKRKTSLAVKPVSDLEHLRMPICRRLAALLLIWLGLSIANPTLAGGTHIAAELVAEQAATPGQTVTLAIHMRPADGWHGYWINPGDAGLGMTLDWQLPRGAQAETPLYPVPETLLVKGMMNHVFAHDYAVLVPVTLPADSRMGSDLAVRVKADWLACTDQICVPESADLAVNLRIGPPGERDARFDGWRQALPAPLGSAARFAVTDKLLRIAIPLPASQPISQPHLFMADDHLVEYAAAQTFSRQGDLLLVDLPRAVTAPASPAHVTAVLRLNSAGDGVAITADPGAVPPAGVPLVDSTKPDTPSLPLLLLMALAGGLLLNVMPCVFPILSLKALSLARAGESEGQARREGLAYSAGVIIACLALGGLLLALRAAGQQVGWAFQLQEPLVVAALLLLAVAITANLLGLFEFAVPGFAGDGSPQGAFATGLLAAFVATPCTGPFMAAAMGAALLLPVPQALLLFAALGLGLALPFLALAFIPALRRRLPRPGAWMVTFRRAMALPMGLTALALGWLASRTAGDRFALSAGLIAVCLIALLALVGQTQRRGNRVALQAGIGLAMLAELAALFLPGTVRDPAQAALDLLKARPFSQQALNTALASGSPVFLYFTADWCLTCKVNESTSIEREETRAALSRKGVIVMRGDWTRRDPAITRFLTARGAAGVPLYLWYPAGGGEPQQLPQVLGGPLTFERLTGGPGD
jgi:thiol:disulfide interchange protein